MPFLSLKVSPGRKEGRGPWDGCAEQILKALCSALGPTEASVPDCVCLTFHWMKWDSNVCIIHRETSTWRQQQRAVLLLLQNIYIAERGHEWKWTVCIIQNLSAIKVKYVLFFFYNLLAHLFNLWEKNYRKLFFSPEAWNTLFKYKWICHSARGWITVSPSPAFLPILQEDCFHIHCVAFSLCGLLHTEINLPYSY